MAYNSSKGRGKFKDPIELKYIQIPHSVFQSLYVDFASFPEATRMLALYHYVYHYFTNMGYESLKLKDMQAYVICKALDASTEIVQNNARWKCHDEFYKGRLDLDYEAARDLEQEEQQQKRKDRNHKYYLGKKDREALLREEKEKQDTIIKELIDNLEKKED